MAFHFLFCSEGDTPLHLKYQILLSVGKRVLFPARHMSGQASEQQQLSASTAGSLPLAGTLQQPIDTVEEAYNEEGFEPGEGGTVVLATNNSMARPRPGRVDSYQRPDVVDMYMFNRYRRSLAGTRQQRRIVSMNNK